MCINTNGGVGVRKPSLCDLSLQHYTTILQTTMKTIITQTCAECSAQFEMIKAEHTRQMKKGRKSFFCSLTCVAIHHNPKKSPESIKNNIERLARMNQGNEYCKKGEFTTYLKRTRSRKDLTQDLTEEYLKSIWTGTCALTGVPIFIQNHKTSATLFSASLDRIDSSVGYMIGNVQFVALGVNLAKNKFSNDHFSEFLNMIRTTNVP